MDYILELLITYSYLILFLGVVVEGEIFPLAAGFLVSLSLMNLYGALIVVFIGAVIGDILWFIVARRWGRKLVERWGKFLMLKPSRLQWLEEHFKQNGKKTLAITKFIYSFGHASIIVAGIAKMDFKEFLKVDIMSCLGWALLFTLLGHAYGASFTLLQDMLKDALWAAVIIIGFIFLAQIYLRKKITQKI